MVKLGLLSSRLSYWAALSASRPRRAAVAGPLMVLALLAGCTTAPQVHETTQHQVLALATGDLEMHGLAFVTPSTVTGQEQDIQALSFTFAEVLRRERPQVRCLALPETLGAVNRAGFADEYRDMYVGYRDTGIFRRDALRRLAEITGVRYVAQLKLAGFRQGSSTRWSLLGVRLLVTRDATVRLFFQVWDAEQGVIAWEGVEELLHSEEAFTERNITFRTVIEQAATNLIARLPVHESPKPAATPAEPPATR